MGFIEYKDISKHFRDVTAVDDISLSIKEGEFVALLGPSGAGKTTLLRTLAGFEKPSEGEIILDGENITHIPPHKRDAGMVFQEYALFPHMTVAENIAFGMNERGYENDRIDEQITNTLKMVDMEGLKQRQPAELSGGQRQRVATARAIAIEPKVLLMDEPLGALDKKLRERLELELVQIQQKLGITTLYVTHNQTEALTMADRIAIMREGHIEQIGTPEEIYNRPKTRFVADFVGDANFLDGDLVQRNGETILRLSESDIQFNQHTHPYSNSQQITTVGGSMFVRPESITLNHSAPDEQEMNCLPGTIDNILFVGSRTRYYIDANDQEIVVDTQQSNPEFETDDTVYLTWARNDTHLTKPAEQVIKSE